MAKNDGTRYAAADGCGEPGSRPARRSCLIWRRANMTRLSSASPTPRKCCRRNASSWRIPRSSATVLAW